MNIYYEIPQNYSYVNFAKTFIQLKHYTAKYVQQFTVSNKTILYVGNKKISTLPTNTKILPFTSYQTTTEPSSSSVCCSIRINDLDSHVTPYEYIANKICNFPYLLTDAVLHTDQYGVQRLIFI